MRLIFGIFSGLSTIALFGGAIYMAINSISGWGWLLFVGLVLAAIMYDFFTDEKEEDE